MSDPGHSVGEKKSVEYGKVSHQLKASISGQTEEDGTCLQRQQGCMICIVQTQQLCLIVASMAATDHAVFALADPRALDIGDPLVKSQVRCLKSVLCRSRVVQGTICLIVDVLHSLSRTRFRFMLCLLRLVEELFALGPSLSVSTSGNKAWETMGAKVHVVLAVGRARKSFCQGLCPRVAGICCNSTGESISHTSCRATTGWTGEDASEVRTCLRSERWRAARA